MKRINISLSASLTLFWQGICLALCTALLGCDQLPVVRETIRAPLSDIISVTPAYVSATGGYSSATIKWQTNKSGEYVIKISGCDSGTSIGSGSIIGGEIKDTSIAASSLTAGPNTLHFCIAESGGGTKDIPFSLTRDDQVPVLEVRNGSNNLTNGGVFTSAETITLTCADSGGAGCEKFVYTTNNTVPSFSPENGQVVTSQSTTITLSTGNIRLRYKTADKAGNTDVYKEMHFIVSASTSYPGVLYIATDDGIARSYGRDRVSYLNVTDQLSHTTLFYDSIAKRLYSLAGGFGAGSGVYIASRTDNLLNNARAWSQRGPDDGIIDKTYNDIEAYGAYVYVATNNGIAISKNYGDTFSNISVGKYTVLGLELNTAVRKLFVDYKKDNPATSEIYAATNEIGLVKSSNNGLTFSAGITAFGTAFTFKQIYDVNVFENKVYVLAKNDSTENRGIIICAERECQTGFTYVAVPELNVSGDYFTRMRIINRRLYAGSNKGLFIYDIDGGTYVQKTGFGAQNIVNSVVQIGDTLGVMANNGVYICDDLVCTNAPSLKDESTGLPGNTTYDAVFADNRLYVVSQAGFSISTNMGSSFSAGAIGSGLSDNLIYAVKAISDGGVRYLYAATRFGLSISQDGGATFTSFRTKDGLGASATTDVDIDTTNKYVYISTNDGLSVCTNLTCTGTITTWFNTANSNSQGLGVRSISGKVFFGTKNALHYCADYQCTTRSSYVTGFETHAITSYGGQLYLSTGTGLRQCTDATDCDNVSGYTSIANAVPSPLTAPHLTLAVSTDNIYSLTQDGLAKTAIGGGVGATYTVLVSGLVSPASGGKYDKLSIATDTLDVLGRRDYLYFPSRQGLFIHKGFISGTDVGTPMIEINRYHGLGSNNVYGTAYLP